MSRVSPQRTSPDWEGLYQLAEAQGGYFTAKQAAGFNLGPRVLSYHVGTGALLHPGRGIFRLRRFPSSPHEELIPLWLWSGGIGLFSHETALVLRSLSDLLPTAATMTVPKAWSHRRLKVPDGLVLHFADVQPEDREFSGPVPVTGLVRTLNDCAAAGVEEQFLRQAIQEALAQGTLPRRAVPELDPMLQIFARDEIGARP